MVDTEVVEILREIRERVIAEAGHQSLAEPRYDSDPAVKDDANRLAADTLLIAALKRLETVLPTIARASNQLPPITSRRTGAFGRLELWFKRLVRSLMHWFTWEQVNFNTAVSDALNDLVRLVRIIEASSTQRREFLNPVEAGRSLKESCLVERSAKVAPVSETAYDERLAALLDEQRVILKQLELEMSEDQINIHGIRRMLQQRLDDLVLRIEDLRSSGEVCR